MDPESSRLGEVFAAQRAAFRALPYPSLAQRKSNLRDLAAIVSQNRDAIAAAIDEDFGGRAKDETMTLEVMQVLQLISHILTRLRRWMRPSRKSAGLLYMPARARLHYQPLGVVGIVSPWNYPLDLALSPLACALAAGNRVMLKPSEHTPRTSELFRQLLGERFGEEHVAVITGDAEVGVEFSRLPFDHLMFTGSTAVGRSVMASAAENLTPVTLELGGKSPCIVGREAGLSQAVQRICFGKSINSAQTCIAPDHVFLPRGREEEFVEEYRRCYAKLYPDGELSSDYSCVINDAQFDRLQALLEDARSKGARVEVANEAGEWTAGASRRMPPHIILDVSDEMTMMQQEIFGPLLPVVLYDSMDEVIEEVARGERPLALYYFGGDRRNHRRILRETHSGGVVFNDTSIQFAIKSLPFGGVGASGMGSYHGHEGFLTFSHARAVVSKGWLNPLRLGYPPYGSRVHKLIERIFIR